MVAGCNFNKFIVQNDICVATDHIAFKVCLMRKSLGDMLYFCLLSAFFFNLSQLGKTRQEGKLVWHPRKTKLVWSSIPCSPTNPFRNLHVRAPKALSSDCRSIYTYLAPFA